VAWIKLHQSVGTHRKTYLLAEALGLETAQAVGHLALLWCWALDNAPDGFLNGTPAGCVARAAQWAGDAGAFVDALVDVGYLDAGADGLCLHDWDEYAGILVEKREANAARMRRARAQREENTCAERAQNVQRTCDARAGAREEKRREEKKIPPTPYEGECASVEFQPLVDTDALPDRYDEWRTLYGRNREHPSRNNWPDGRKAWDALLRRKVTADQVLLVTRYLLATDRSLQSDAYKPGPGPFLRKLDLAGLLPDALAWEAAGGQTLDDGGDVGPDWEEYVK
jgi:hypothetical protein